MGILTACKTNETNPFQKEIDCAFSLQSGLCSPMQAMELQTNDSDMNYFHLR